MSALGRIAVPLWSPPRIGPWRLRWTRPDGSSFASDDWGIFAGSRYYLYADAVHWAGIAQRGNLEGCVVTVELAVA